MSKINNQIATQDNSKKIIEIHEVVAPYQGLEIPDPLDPQFEEPPRYRDYTRLQEGNNNFRILSEGVTGVEYWKEEFDQETKKMRNKPIRKPISEATTLETPDWAYFQAFFVWNYTAKKIQILSTTKRGIINGLKTLINNQSWGDITQYDICITRRQTDPSKPLSVEYTVNPVPPALLDPEISQQWQDSGFNRNALYLLFAGLDPFEYQRTIKEQELAKNLRSKA
jgi:hypothetical protein